ncbi:MAG: NAD(P)H-dependent oxidoreductase [Pseudomonas sp.]
MGKRVAVIVGHPAADSWCGALADSYAAAARAGGHEVRMLQLAQLDFDPSLHEGYRQIQALEPDLLAAQATLAWAEHLVIAYPIWWGSVPALLKGFLDRILLPGFAFKYRPGKAFPEQLLRGRSAQLLVSMDTPPWYFRWVYRMPGIVQLKKTTLEFCGIAPVKVAAFGPLIASSPAQRASWLVKVARLADGL